MQCPIDATELVMTERQGVEIDYCPKCRGVWLDRGELDKIIERATPPAPSPAAPQMRPDYRPEYRDEKRYDPRHKRKSLLGEIFDF